MSDVSEDLTAYIDGELPPEQVRVVEAALAQDPKLRALEQRLRAAVGAVEALPAPVDAPSPALRRNVLAALEQPSWWARWFTLPRLAPVGLALAAAVALLVWPGAAVDEGPPPDEEKLLLAQHLEVVEDLDLVGLDSMEDLDVVASLHELEVTP